MTFTSLSFLLSPRISPRSAAHQERRRHQLSRPLCSLHAPRRRRLKKTSAGAAASAVSQQSNTTKEVALAAAESRVWVSVCFRDGVCRVFLPTFHLNCFEREKRDCVDVWRMWVQCRRQEGFWESLKNPVCASCRKLQYCHHFGGGLYPIVKIQNISCAMWRRIIII